MRTEGSLKAIIYDGIFEDIVRGEYHAGEILNESRMVEKFGYSRAPVREALAALCSDGILKNLPRYGYEVLPITTGDIENMLQFRRILEGGLIERYWQNISPEDFAELRALAERCCRGGDSIWEHWETNTQFHIKLCAAAGNGYALDVLQQTMTRLKCAYGQHYFQKWDLAYPSDMHYHMDMLDALERGDVPEALRQLERDLEDFGSAS